MTDTSDAIANALRQHLGESGALLTGFVACVSFVDNEGHLRVQTTALDGMHLPETLGLTTWLGMQVQGEAADAMYSDDD